MDRKQLVPVIVVLTLTAVACVIALGVGLGRGRRTRVTAAQIEDSVAGGLESMLGGLAPRVDTRRLYCNRQRVSSGFVLTESRPSCEIELAGSETHDYLALELEQVGQRKPIWLRSEQQHRGDVTLTTDCKPPEEVEDLPRLEVSYTPAGERAPESSCWILHPPDRPLKLVIMKDGGRLELACRGCSESLSREIRLRLS